MAIEPIQQYRDSGNSLLQILQNGSQTITGVLDRAIQIGRDISNKRTQQEQDMAGMRRDETNLAQRRAENLQKSIEDAQRFAESTYRFDQNFAANRSDTAFTQNRTSAQDVLQQQNADRNYNLATRGMTLRENEEKRQADAASAELARIQTERENAELALKKTEAASAPSTPQPTTEIPPMLKRVEETPVVRAEESPLFYGPVSRENPSGVVQPSVSDVLTLPTTQPAPARSKVPTRDRLTVAAELSALKSNYSTRLDPKLRQEYAAKIGSLEEELDILRDTKSGVEGLSPTQELAQKKYADAAQKDLEEDAEKRWRETVKGDIVAFKPQSVVVAQREENAGKPGVTIPKPTDTEKAEALQWDENRFEMEKATANRMGEDGYVALGPDKNPEAQRVRREFHQWVKSGGKIGKSVPSAGGAVSSIPGYKPKGKPARIN